MSVVVYLFLLIVGAVGFILMTVMGFAHGIGGHHSAAVGHAKVPLPGHHTGGPMAHSSGNAHSAAASHLPKISMKGLRLAPAAASDPWRLVMAVSPIDIFAIAVGAGAVGTLLQTFLSGWELAWASAVGGLLFCFAFIRPFMGLFLRFASRPSEGLEGEVASLAEATTNFDAQGRGMVKLHLDEQVVQLLAYLEPGELTAGTQVKRGESVVVVSVDPKRNTCTVSRELAPSSAYEASFDSSQNVLKQNL